MSRKQGLRLQARVKIQDRLASYFIGWVVSPLAEHGSKIRQAILIGSENFFHEWMTANKNLSGHPPKICCFCYYPKQDLRKAHLNMHYHMHGTCFLITWRVLEVRINQCVLVQGKHPGKFPPTKRGHAKWRLFWERKPCRFCRWQNQQGF